MATDYAQDNWYGNIITCVFGLLGRAGLSSMVFRMSKSGKDPYND